MDRVTSRLASAIVDVVEFLRVWDRIKPIHVSNTVRRLDLLWTYTLNDIVAISLLIREVATKSCLLFSTCQGDFASKPMNLPEIDHVIICQ